ncbi:NAD(P)-dependent oxidoreductase [Rhodoferax sediminis]|uniref:NAD(P)-dependent oxidoreductase n=1 Tax=Rhodoferax sediminis TaxID=2509614 RepID=A0A515DDT8_9BURK|nr:NAD(P)-dependent oxidoreductase [Rhodoferax sediminis]QDL38588.1 NAD(P)-dependent oxidoreductase [Rhodoferax sediminis]
MRIGYIGLGAMGSALARRLLAGHELRVWDLNPAAMSAFAQLGAMAAACAAEVARDSDIVMLCLPRSADVRQVIFGAGGLANELAAGQLVIDQTSGTPQETATIADELAVRGVAMVDAPVSGNPEVVAAGRGTIMVSGTDAACERALPVLRELAAHVLRCGSRLGDAQAMKLVNNTINAGCRLATLEAAALGRKLGLSLAAITEMLNRGAARNRTTQVMLPALAEGKAASNFALALMLKDLNQSTTLGRELGVPMPLAGLVRGLHQVGVNTLGDRAQLDQVAQLMETMASTKVAAPGGEAVPEALATVEALVAASNIALTWEAVAVARRYGLALDAIASVLAVASGSSAAAKRLLPEFVEGGDATALLQPWMAHLRGAAEEAVRAGAPLLIANAVLALAAAPALNRCQPAAS